MSLRCFWLFAPAARQGLLCSIGCECSVHILHGTRHHPHNTCELHFQHLSSDSRPLYTMNCSVCFKNIYTVYIHFLLLYKTGLVAENKDLMLSFHRPSACVKWVKSFELDCVRKFDSTNYCLRDWGAASMSQIAWGPGFGSLTSTKKPGVVTYTCNPALGW